jgi:hypothetical protein
MMVSYTSYDLRFTRDSGREITPPCTPAGRRFLCHLFSPTRVISVTEDGRVMPCSAIAHRHAQPVIADLDAFGRLPLALALHIEDCGRLFLKHKGNRYCDLLCKNERWSLDSGSLSG